MTQSLHAEPRAQDSWAAEEERLAVLGRTRLLDQPPEPELDRWTAALRQDTDAAVAALVLVDAKRGFVKSLCGVDGCAKETYEIPLSESSASHLLDRGAPAVAVRSSPAYAEAPVSIDGRVLGWMAIVDGDGRTWSETELRALENAAAAVSTEFRLRLAHQEAARVRDLVASHNRLHELIAQAAPLSQVLGELVEGIERYEPSVIPCVVLLDRESNTLHPGAGPSLPPEYFAAIDGVVIGPNVGTCGSAAWSGQLTITEDIAVDPKWAPIRDFVIGAGLRHCWSMPVKAPDDEVLGTLALYGPRPRQPLPEHLALMRDGARLAGIAIERHRTMEALIHAARHDSLTGLLNRTALFEQLDQAIQQSDPASKIAVLFVDLDGLKALNDTFGHDRADEMIRLIGARLSAAVRAGELVGRFGGDEFIVIAKGILDEEQAAELGFRLLDAISKPMPGMESTVVTASVGITLIGAAATDAREAIRQADSAMYTSKRAGRGGCSFFEGSRRIRGGRSQSLAHELRNAEMRSEMKLVFEPVFELAGSQIVAVEALPHWRSPRFGDVSSSEFMPIAEYTGAIVPLGAWVLRESCETLARIADSSGSPPELAVAVSAHQLARPGFAKSVYQTLMHAEFPASRLTLEIPEAALMHPTPITVRTLHELGSLGVRIILDDFGGGHSSIRWLQGHPLAGVKIDRTFVGDLSDDGTGRAIVAAMIGIAAALGATITAEGVETTSQLEALRELGCDRAQGLLLGGAVGADQLAALLR